jgi:hypothetical protein
VLCAEKEPKKTRRLTCCRLSSEAQLCRPLREGLEHLHFDDYLQYFIKG